MVQFKNASTNVSIVGEDLWIKWSVKKHCVAKVLRAIWDIFLHENNRNYNSYKFSYKFVFTLFFSFLTSQKQESGFQQVDL